MNCPSCGAPVRLEEGASSAFCEYCQATCLAEKNEEGVRAYDQRSELSCPICQEPLLHATMARQRILYCTRCRGSLISMPVFVVLIEVLRARRGEAVEIAPPPDPQHLRRTTFCPQCGSRMDTHYYAGGGNVVIDDCSRCELNWLDAGELMAIARAPDHSLDRRSPIEIE
jgi:LSD1 subclass zinc finger protein